jgi:site-specific recombinase, resolvase family
VQSGKNMERAELKKLVSKIRKNDTFIVTDIDRLERNFTEVTELYTKLKEMNINIIVINQELLNHRVDDKKDEIVNVVIIPLLIYLAERERTTLIERINDGIRNMPVNDLGRKFSRKTGNCVERLLSPLIYLKRILRCWNELKIRKYL